MAVEKADRTTIDMFSHERRPGRPRTNPLPREQQQRINKRNQIKRDKAAGLQRVEIKIDAHLADLLAQAAEQQQTSRSEFIVNLLKHSLSHHN